MTVEHLILSNLVNNEKFTRKVIPFIKKDYFQERGDEIVFNLIQSHFDNYNSLPNSSVLTIGLSERKDISESVFDEATDIIKTITKNCQKQNFDYLIDTTEKWVQDSAFFNALLEATEVIDGDKGKVSKSGIPDKMTEALAITFDDTIGHDWEDDAEARYDSYDVKDDRVPFRLKIMNDITKGGLIKKSLTILISTNTGGFKSGTMCSWAADNVRDGMNVLYISCEMPEEQVTGRIDANLLDVDLDDLPKMGKLQYMKAIEKTKSKYMGKFKVKEYPTSTAHAGHMRYLLRELREKKNFKPDIIYIDYLNICASQRLPTSASSNMYTYVKAIAEELRALTNEFDVPIVTATQGNRGVAGASDLSVSDVSESMGITHTADYIFGVITTEEFDEAKQIMYKQLKNRYGDTTKYRTFVCPVNKARMRVYDSVQKPVLTAPAVTAQPPGSDASRSAKFTDFSF